LYLNTKVRSCWEMYLQLLLRHEMYAIVVEDVFGVWQKSYSLVLQVTICRVSTFAGDGLPASEELSSLPFRARALYIT
jgi:hypothetical protein